MEGVFGFHHVNCVDIEISALGSRLNIPAIRHRLTRYYGLDSEEARRGLHNMVQGGGNYRIFTNVTPGWAYDFEVWAREVLPDVELEYIGKVEPNKDNISNPLSAEQKQKQDSATLKITSEFMDTKKMLGEASEALAEANANNKYLTETREYLQGFVVRLQKDNDKLARALQGKYNDVRIDPNDPDHYIVRPSALTEMRLLGQLSNDVVSITFQLLKPKTLRILRDKGSLPNAYGYKNNYDPPSPEFMDKNGTVLKQVRRACRPNTRGSINGTLRALGALKAYTGHFHGFENACVLISNHSSGRHLRKSKFNW